MVRLHKTVTVSSMTESYAFGSNLTLFVMRSHSIDLKRSASYQIHMTSYQHRFISLLDALKLNLIVETVVWKFLCSVVLILPETVPNRSSLLTVHKLLTLCSLAENERTMAQYISHFHF